MGGKARGNWVAQVLGRLRSTGSGGGWRAVHWERSLLLALVCRHTWHFQTCLPRGFFGRGSVVAAAGAGGLPRFLLDAWTSTMIWKFGNMETTVASVEELTSRGCVKSLTGPGSRAGLRNVKMRTRTWAWKRGTGTRTAARRGGGRVGVRGESGERAWVAEECEGLGGGQVDGARAGERVLRGRMS